MFTTKKSSLLDKPVQRVNAGNSFTNAANGFVQTAKRQAAKTTSGNGALKFSTTGNVLVDEFAQCAAYKQPRTYAEIEKSMSTQWAENQSLAVKFLFYLRMITRQVQLWDGSKTASTQRGQGLRHEGIFRMIWLAVNHPKVFWDNILLFISVGSWKDVITMLQYDLVYNGWKDRKLNWDNFGNLILAGLENPNSSELLKKYLPQIKSNSACKTVESQADNIIAKWICSLLFGTKENNIASDGTTYKMYRRLKTSGTAHEWQQLISQGKFLKINFDSIHGRALAQLVSGKFLANNKLEAKYAAWIESKPVAKYTGYVYELLATIPKAVKPYQVQTINKQFKMLVEQAKKGANLATSFIVVRDTSSSMNSPATGTTIAAGDIAKGLSIFFGELLPEGHFANSWIEFNSEAKFNTWKGSTVVEKWKNDARTGYVGGTDFQSVIRLFIKIKKQGIAESEFPTGILCISDSEFNPAQLGKTNVESARASLRQAGFSAEYVENFKIVLWNLRSNFYGPTTGGKFETYGNVKNVFYFGGLDGSIVTFLTGMTGKSESTPSTAEELFQAAMDQDVLNMITV